MKILQINCVYGSGSTGKITKDIHMNLLERQMDSYVCYGRGRKNEDNNVIKVSSDFGSRIRKVFSSIDGMPYYFTKWTNKKLEKIIRELQPDIVHLQCINGYFVDIYRLLKFLKVNNFKTILTLHAEFMYTGGCGYALDCEQWKLGCVRCSRLKGGLGVRGRDKVKKNYEMMKKSFRDFSQLVIVGVSDWISERAKNSNIMMNHNVITIHNGIDTTNIFYPRKTERIVKKYGIPSNKKIVLSVVPNLTSDLKGGSLMMNLATYTNEDDLYFIIVGAKEVEKNIPNNMLIVPYTESQDELAEIYSLADVFVLGSKMDNYPTVCLEANSCGTPVIGFDVGGVKETIFPNMGEVIPYGNDKLLKQTIVKWIDKKSTFSNKMLEEVRKRNSKERMTEEYLSLYLEVLSKK
ncbi:glycosyltransferase [Dorea phocaeensis]|uniref:glycosyltransferase n=1 Tax=Dorea phocaeensis TaxID=2040291 RepID=UPI000C781A62|nr:glycosyltransferase [Dorea phocaeensis]